MGIELIDAGMNVARLNMSHGDHKSHMEMVSKLRAAVKERPGSSVAIMLDTKGPEIRTGKLVGGGPVTYDLGSEVIVSTDYEAEGNPNLVACSYKDLTQSIEIGSKILIADGSLVLEVKEIKEEHSVVYVAKNTATIGERKNMNLPGAIVSLPTCTERDVADIVDFGVPAGIDYIAASFVRKASDIHFIREILGGKGEGIKIIAKIENQEGMNNYEDILRAADAIMVARGDLGMEIPPEKVFLAQKMMIAKCNLAGKPVITATQMLESMVTMPRPTRAEASDVANAVLDGTDCVMLSGETAAGSFPINAVSIMRRICEEAESVLDYNGLYLNIRMGMLKFGPMSSAESICSSAVKSTVDSNCPLIIALTETGSTALMIAKYKPKATILAITASETAVRQLLVIRGVVPMLTASFVGTDSVIQKALTRAKSEGMVQSGDTVVAVHRQREECPGHTNLMKMVVVS